MTTPSVLPQKLWRPLAEIKNFVEKMPDGVRLTEVTKKVKTFAELSGKERNQLIDFIDKRESIIVFKVRKEGSGNGVTFFRHKKYGYPKREGNVTIIKDLQSKLCTRCGQTKSVDDFYSDASKRDGRAIYCKKCESAMKRSRRECNKLILQQQEPEMNNLKAVSPSPEILRKQAEELLKAAEIAEKKRQKDDVFNKKLAPLKLEILQAAGKMQLKLDEFIDCMDEMNKAVQKLKELTA